MLHPPTVPAYLELKLLRVAVLEGVVNVLHGRLKHAARVQRRRPFSVDIQAIKKYE